MRYALFAALGVFAIAAGMAALWYDRAPERAAPQEVPDARATSATSTTATDTPRAEGTNWVKDFSVYAEPPLPKLGEAGSTFTDPTFGTKILRVTDESMGEDFRMAYATVPAINSNSTRIYIVGPRSNPWFATLDAEAFTVSRPREVVPPPGVAGYWMLWSGTRSNIIYGFSARELFAYNVAHDTWDSVRVFTEEEVPVGYELNQMAKSEDDAVFAWTLVQPDVYPYERYLVWDRAADNVTHGSMKGLDEVSLDKSGRFLVMAGEYPDTQVHDLRSGVVTSLPSEKGFAHHGLGSGIVVTDGATTSFGVRSLTMPATIRSLLKDIAPSLRGRGGHYARLPTGDAAVLVSLYREGSGPSEQLFDNEIFLIALDGSDRVKRLAHHRSRLNEYYDAPMANISADGRFVAFNSNWGNPDGRRDVFILKVR